MSLISITEYMEEPIQNYLQTVMFRGTPYIKTKQICKLNQVKGTVSVII